MDPTFLANFVLEFLKQTCLPVLRWGKLGRNNLGLLQFDCMFDETRAVAVGLVKLRNTFPNSEAMARNINATMCLESLGLTAQQQQEVHEKLFLSSTCTCRLVCGQNLYLGDKICINLRTKKRDGLDPYFEICSLHKKLYLRRTKCQADPRRTVF